MTNNKNEISKKYDKLRFNIDDFVQKLHNLKEVYESNASSYALDYIKSGDEEDKIMAKEEVTKADLTKFIIELSTKIK